MYAVIISIPQLSLDVSLYTLRRIKSVVNNKKDRIFQKGVSMSYLAQKQNRLSSEESPYLLQHANNPVDWYPWGDEAFLRAKRENKPIFLSIGYSACHWCHVMEREVFENKQLAELLNELFVSIKVDREERPDIDKHFQHIHYIITRRSGGWPTSIFLTPDKKPFFAATYIPPTTKHGMMGFGETITLLSNKLKNSHDEVLKVAENISQAAKTADKRERGELGFELLPVLKNEVQKSFDAEEGGILGEPKFPHAALLMLMLESKDGELISKAAHTLKCMAKGGMYDIVEGGFCRYSVDSFWLVPHFEKMTYDNGLLIEAYAKAYGVTREPLFLRIARECTDFMMDKMSENQLFYSASDADSEGEEGRYFVYSWSEAFDALSAKNITNIECTLKILGFSKIGNFEHKNIPRNENFADGEDVKNALKILRDIRNERIYPFIDTKIICSWNAMMISGMFELAKHDRSYLDKAITVLDSLKNKLFKQGALYHCAMVNGEAKIEAFLEDYAFLAKAYLSAHEASGNREYKAKAAELVNTAIEKFYRKGIWMLSVGEFETEADASDSSYSSPIGVICEVALCLGNEFETVLSFSLSMYANEIKKYPLYYASLAKVYLMLHSNIGKA